MRRPVIGLLVVVGATTITACGGSGAAPSSSSTGSPSPTVPLTTTTGPSPLGADLSLCEVNPLRVLSATTQGATTSLATGVKLTNNAASGCSLSAPSSIQLIAPNGTALPVEFKQIAGQPSTGLGNLTLQPHAAFGLITQWSNWCGSPLSSEPMIRFQFGVAGPTLTVPMDTESQMGNVGSPLCHDPSSGSFIALVQWSTSS